MSTLYLCPNCKTNRTRFTLVEQHPRLVKVDPETGEMIEEYSVESKSPFHLPYDGPSLKIQCGVCGLLEDEERFKKYAIYEQRRNT